MGEIIQVNNDRAYMLQDTQFVLICTQSTTSDV